MPLLQKASNTMAKFKAGIFGFQGSGKTFTATDLAIGICKLIKNKKMAFFDTETGSDFLIPKINKNGIEVFQVKSRAFGDLLSTIKECVETGVGVLNIDSITHVWRDLMTSYDKKLKRNGRLQFQDWAKIKGEWQIYTDLFVNSDLHIIVCGRAGYDYDYSFNPDGSKDLIKTATKMKAESEFGFEPSLVIEMERLSETLEDIKRMKRHQKQSFSPKVGSKSIHRMHILKDRTDTLNGRSFDYFTGSKNTPFNDIKPHIDRLNLEGKHFGFDQERTSEDRFDFEGKPDWKKEQEKKKIALEEILESLKFVWPGATGKDKLARQGWMKHVFETMSWKKIEQERLENLEPIVGTLKQFVESYLKDPNTDNIGKLWDELHDLNI